MKRWLKIFLTIILILILIVIIITYLQASSIKNLNSNPTILNNWEYLAKGDCSKLQLVEKDWDYIKEKIKSACINPLIYYFVIGKETCSKTDNSKNEGIEYFKSQCNNYTISIN